MALQPIASTVELTTATPLGETRQAIAREVLALKGARPGTEGWLQFRLGSAAWLRIWGLWTPRAYTHLPLVVDVSVTDLGNERRVRIEYRSEEGPYLFRLGRVEPAYHRRFTDITATVQRALS